MKKGFTMIELIFVIVILGVLAAVAIPKLNATRDDAEQAKAMTNLATLMGDLTSYYTAQGSFQEDVSTMTNVPLVKDTADGSKKYFYQIKNATCLTFEANKTNGTLTIASPESSPNPVCNNLIGNTATQNILSGSYQCQGTYTVENNGSVKYEDAAIDQANASKGTKDDKAGMKTACSGAVSTITVKPGDTTVAAPSIPAKIDAFNKTITMSFQGGGVAF